MGAGRKGGLQTGKKRCSTLKLPQVPRERPHRLPQPHRLPRAVRHPSPARSRPRARCSRRDGHSRAPGAPRPPRPCRRGSSGKEPTGGSRGASATTGGMRHRDPRGTRPGARRPSRPSQPPSFPLPAGPAAAASPRARGSPRRRRRGPRSWSPAPWRQPRHRHRHRSAGTRADPALRRCRPRASPLTLPQARAAERRAQRRDTEERCGSAAQLRALARDRRGTPPNDGGGAGEARRCCGGREGGVVTTEGRGLY